MDWPASASPSPVGQYTSIMQYRNRLYQCGVCVLAAAGCPRLRADSILSADTFVQSAGPRWSR